MGEKNTLNILDLGCGTGGEILGLLNYMSEKWQQMFKRLFL